MDADACPVKEEIYRVARRHDLGVTLVAASWMRIPRDARVALEVVEQDFDAADDWIVANALPGDVVITADVPLAARCIGKGVRALGPTGHPFTESNIGDVLATRNLLAGMRAAGQEMMVGPPPFVPRDRSRFLQALDRAINAPRDASARHDPPARSHEA